MGVAVARSKSAKGKRVFLSYAEADNAFAEELRRILVLHGAAVVLDSTVLLSSGDVQEALLRALKESDLVTFVVPRREGEGKNALFEIGAARALGKPIVSVVSDPARSQNADVARVLSRSPLVDASRLSDDALADAILGG